jgi:hypothetical protein
MGAIQQPRIGRQQPLGQDRLRQPDPLHRPQRDQPRRLGDPQGYAAALSGRSAFDENRKGDHIPPRRRPHPGIGAIVQPQFARPRHPQPHHLDRQRRHQLRPRHLPAMPPPALPRQFRPAIVSDPRHRILRSRPTLAQAAPLRQRVRTNVCT